MKNTKNCYTRISKKALSVFVIVLVLISISTNNLADVPYYTYTIDSQGIRRTQTAYSPHDTIIKFGDQGFASPSDLYIKDEKLYVADTENARVLVGNLDGELVKVIGENELVSPRGVFVAPDQRIYVADRDAEAIFVYGPDYKLENKYEKPNSPLYGEGIPFLPIKIAVNDAGVMFIVSEANTNGVIQISPAEGGTFLGYFGTNLASVDFMTLLYRAILTDAQRAKMVSNLPSTPDNLEIDEKGLIYTVTRGDGRRYLKRLNIAGVDMMDGLRVVEDVPAAVTVGNHDNIFVVSRQGHIFEYNFEGDMLFLFSGMDDGTQRIGLSTIASAIQVDKQDRIYVLDQDKAQIQIFQPTEFTLRLHDALDLYSSGRYTDSKEPLQGVLDVNSMFTYANKAMGRAYFQEENYDQAMYYSRLAYDKDGYSDAFWEVRNTWLKTNLIWIVVVVVAVLILRKLFVFLNKKKQVSIPFKNTRDGITTNIHFKRFTYGKYFAMHPVEGAYGVAREGYASYLVSFIILVIFTLVYVINRYTRGFLTKPVPDGYFNVFNDLSIVLIGFFAVVLSHYLVCEIQEGEGSFKKIFTYMCFALIPYIFLTPISYVLSFVLTNNEVFFFNLIKIIIIIWTLVLVYISVKDVNNYSVQETVKVILLTLFTLFALGALIFIIYVFSSQVIEFIKEVFGEVVYKNA